MSGRVFVDTNVFAYLFDDGAPAKRARAADVLQRQRRTGEIVASTQVLQELYVCLTRGPAPLASPELAEKAVDDVAKLTIVPVDVALVREAIGLSRRHRLSFWDALIVRAAVAGRCERLLTEDLNDGQTIDGVRIENPLAGGKLRPVPR